MATYTHETRIATNYSGSGEGGTIESVVSASMIDLIDEMI
jgi:hypothetical protein